MQQFQDPAAARVSDAEANEIVRLWSERQRALDPAYYQPPFLHRGDAGSSSGGPGVTIAEIAHALQSTPTEVALMLADVRGRLAQQASLTVKQPPHAGVWIALLAALVVAGLLMLSFLSVRTIRSEATAAPSVPAGPPVPTSEATAPAPR